MDMLDIQGLRHSQPYEHCKIPNCNVDLICIRFFTQLNYLALSYFINVIKSQF